MALEMYLSLPFQCWSQRAHCPAQLLLCPASTWDVGVWTQVFILVLQPLNPLSHIAALLPPPLLHPSLYLLPLFLRFYDMFMSTKNSREASAQMSPRKSMDPATLIMNSVLLYPWKKRARRKESDPLGGDLCILSNISLAVNWQGVMLLSPLSMAFEYFSLVSLAFFGCNMMVIQHLQIQLPNSLTKQQLSSVKVWGQKKLEIVNSS